MTDRHAGLLIPLFSAPGSASWGIGELPDVAPFAAWMAGGAFDRLMLLPLGTMPDGERSPYSASSAMAIDPMYIALSRVEEFARAGGEEALSDEGRVRLHEARSSARVNYAAVRSAKREALELAFARFAAEEWETHTPRAAALAAYIARERWWLDDYALFQAIEQALPGKPWREWPEPIRTRDPQALDEVRRQSARDVLRHQYFQWLAETQWQDARTEARASGVTIIGDLPFVVGGDSVDVWSRAGEFLPEVSCGVPPDAFSETGQDWGLPMYAWDVIAAGGFEWLRQRARRMAALYDAFRIDHLVGLYRTYGRPRHGQPFFWPPDEAAQLEQGERILRIFGESGAELLAEDLGTVPDFVRDSLARLAVPGCKVLRWERDWTREGQPFVDPAEYPVVSVALSGTHDTPTLAAWWDSADAGERAALLELRRFREQGLADPAAPWTPELRDALLDAVFAARSRLALLPIQDLFGWRDRVNTPATMDAGNWTWRLPWPVDRMAGVAEAAERARFARGLADTHGRGRS